MTPLIVIGTRPEAIKLAPVARALPEASVLLTGQHPPEMVLPTLEYFGVPIAEKRTHISGLDLPHSFAQAFGWFASRVAGASCVIGQGDTTTAAAAAQAAFYSGIPFVHVEAGLRTYEETPYPEEFNRRLCALAATVHCAPTERAAGNLRQERAGGRIEVTGNTVVDAIQFALDNWETRTRRFDVLVTCHRRENRKLSGRIEMAVAQLATLFPDLAFGWSEHPNYKQWSSAPGVNRFAAPPYCEWIGMMSSARLILTDSGGIQEEAAILGKPCLILRDSTERPEAIECGACRLVGTDTERIVEAATLALDGEQWQIEQNPFGDGKSGERIANIVRDLTNTATEDQSNAVHAATH